MRDRFRPKTLEERARPRQVPPLPPQQSSLEKSSRSQGQPGRPAGDSGEEQVMELEGVYVISVAARILDLHPQTLRKYERLGLINPVRTVGMLRLYSQEDIRKLLLIRYLSENLGLNLAGIEFTLGLLDNLLRMKQRLGVAAEGSQLKPVIEQEIDRLFRNMNLPIED